MRFNGYAGLTYQASSTQHCIWGSLPVGLPREKL